MQPQALILFYPQGHEDHAEPGHPERPERVEAIRTALQKLGWWDRFPHVQPLPLAVDFLQTVHTPAYLSVLEAACQRGVHLDMDTYTTPASWKLAVNAAGGAAAVAAQIWQGPARRGFALTRPPGHHATPSRGMGFCLLNNVALAAEYLLRREGAQRLAIVDLDLHHGNGTQDVFWQRGDVLYVSTHQSPLYPGSGGLEEIGAGLGKGSTVNIPLPPGSGDRAFAAVMESLIIPLLDRFKPEMVLVSVGFDVHWRDPLGSFQLSAAGYHHLIRLLAAWADQHCEGRVALFLEGGYDLAAGAACGQASIAALLELSWQDPLGAAPQPEGTTWESMLRRARHIWSI